MTQLLRALWVCGVAALAAALGCSSGGEEKAATDGKGGQQQAKADPPKVPEGGDEEELQPLVMPGEHGAPVKNEFGHPVQTLVTPQGGKVKVRADHDPWADKLISFKQGKPMSKACPDPGTTVGKPDYVRKVQKTTCLAMGHGGELVLEFVDNRLIDGPGDDIVVFEVGPVVEPVDVAISADNKTWIEVGQLKGAKCTADIGPAVRKAQADRVIAETRPEFRFIKITDTKAGLSNKSTKPGADIDAVGAINSIPAPKKRPL